MLARILLLASLLLPAEVPGANGNAVITYSVTVGKTREVQLSEAEADAIVAAVGKGPYFPPHVTLKRTGKVDTCPGEPIIKDEDQRNALFKSSSPLSAGRVCVVDGVEWCEKLPPPMLGCSDLPGFRIVVVRFGDMEPLLWAHEFSHSKGNDHRWDLDALMYPYICAKCTGLNAFETAKLRAVSQVSPQARPSPKIEPFSRDVLLRAYVHGIPLGTFIQIREKDEPAIRSVLEDPKLRLFHGNALIALAFIPGDRTWTALRDYVGKTREVDATARRNRRAALLGVGYSLALRPNKSAMDFLFEATDPREWLRMKAPWTVDDSAIETREKRVLFESRSLASSAITALGLSGRKEAAAYLEQLRNKGADKEFAFMLPAIEEAMKTNALVQNRGVGALQPQ